MVVGAEKTRDLVITRDNHDQITCLNVIADVVFHSSGESVD